MFGYALAIDRTGTYLYSAGDVISTAQFGALPAITTPTGYVTRMSSVLGTRPATLGGQAVALWPNPASGSCIIQLPALPGSPRAAATLRNSLGQVVRRLALPTGTGSTLDLSGLPAGLYSLCPGTGAETTWLRLAVE